jgi:hypothetical protein
LNLPWLTQLELMSGSAPPLETLDTLKTLTGAPGYEVICKTIIGNQTDECTGNTSVGIENMPTENDVLAIFDTLNGLSEKGTCAQGGVGTSEMVGEGLITALEGLSLAVSAP